MRGILEGRMTRRRTIAVALAMGVVALAAGAAAAQTSTRAGATTAKTTIVKVTLGTKANEYTLAPSVRSIPRGSVTFVVQNRGMLEHEFVVLKTKTAAGKLAMRPGGQQAQETGSLGEIEEFGPGLTKRLTLKVGAGHYVLLCNMPLHYKQGQRSDFNVK